jgi:uncharacterized DUF497 family protein
MTDPASEAPEPPDPPSLPVPLVLEWDEARAAVNLAKHGVPLALGGTVLLLPGCRVVADVAHSGGEARWRASNRADLGAGPRLLVVVFTLRGDDAGAGRAVRVVGVRKGNAREVDADAQERRRAGG